MKTLKNFITYAFDRLLSEPLNSHLCWAGLAAAALYFGSIIIRIIIR